VMREAIGSAEIELISNSGKDMSRGNAIERAVADSFKNACEQFGICAYLDDQADESTKQDFVRYMRSSGDGQAGQIYRASVTGAKPIKNVADRNRERINKFKSEMNISYATVKSKMLEMFSTDDPAKLAEDQVIKLIQVLMPTENSVAS